MQAALAVGQAVAGYRLLRRLGQGSVGVVFLAEQPGPPPRLVALKLVPLPLPPARDAAAAAFLRSAETARPLHHPGIATIEAAGVGAASGLAWLAMEAVPGIDLGRYTAPARLLPERVVLRLAERVALALAYAHARGVVHRDVKPANVLVDWSADSVKLVDFGLARAAGGLQTGTGIVLGSPGYMAPEQLAGALPTAQGDLYALGVMLFQLLAGRLPHEGASMGELLRQVAEVPAPDLRGQCPALPPAVAALVARLLAKHPAKRPNGAAATAAELAALRAAWPSAV